MDWDARARAALCAARGMAHLHAAHGLVHGDVKSSNLLLRHGGDPDNAAALSDYSLQHLFAPLPPSARADGYHAPELVDPRRPTFSSDVYSLGVLFLEILTGKCPASGTAGVDGGGAALDLPRWVQSVVREECGRRRCSTRSWCGWEAARRRRWWRCYRWPWRARRPCLMRDRRRRRC
ncbi:hypothetical protein ACQ4PT_018600 [Festuca glaucescens]